MFEICKNPAAWKSYLPLAKKQEIAEHIAQNALSRYKISLEYGGDEIFDPCLYAEDVPTRWRYQMGALLKFYLCMDFEPVEGEEYLLSTDDYDRAAQKHPLNTLERLKSDAAARDTVFDLLRDYKELERMINAEISATLAARNDLLPRIFAALAATATPAALAQLSEMEKGLAEQAGALGKRIQAAKK